MRCKQHPCDLSSSVGLCASCLRERLFALIAAQVQPVTSRAAPSSSDTQSHPPPLLFPRSVSPYLARRKSDDTSQHHMRFYSTPQVGPTYNGSAKMEDFSISRSYRKKHSRSSFFFSNLFRSRSDNLDPIEPPSSSPSWFSNIFSTRRKKQSKQLYSVSRTRPVLVNRGMSPVGDPDPDDDCGPSASGSGRSSSFSEEESSKRIPATSGPARRGRASSGHVRSASGLAFCLSPLVRASPNRHWNKKGGGLLPDLGFSGEIRGTAAKPHLSAAASFCTNRSRKLADFGKVNHNR